MKIIKSTTRLFVYLGIIGVFICLVLWKQNVVRTKRSKKIVSSIDEWNRNGKPVRVEEVRLKDVKVYTKITLFHTSSTACEGFVPKVIKKKLKIGQIGYSVIGDDERIKGSITEISDEADLGNGMYLIKAKINQEIDNTNAKIIAYVHTNTFENVINVANAAIDLVDGKYYIWKVSSGMAKKQEVEINKQGGYGAIVTKGLSAKDLVVVDGKSLLRENDKVLIISCNNCNENLLKETIR